MHIKHKILFKPTFKYTFKNYSRHSSAHLNTINDILKYTFTHYLNTQLNAIWIHIQIRTHLNIILIQNWILFKYKFKYYINTHL